MSRTVQILMVAAGLILFFMGWWNDRQWKKLMERLPYVRARIRQRMREELCLDCQVGEPHVCRLITEADYATLNRLPDSKSSSREG